MANKKVNKNTKNSNLKTITDTVKKVNAEVQETANYVVNDLAENGQQLRDNAAKAVEGIKLSDSVDKIKSTAGKVNEQIKDAATTISDNVAKRSKKLSETASDRAEEAIEKIDLKGGYTRVKSTVKDVNAYALDTTNELLDMAKANNEEWAKLFNKAVEGGLKLGTRQQTIIFDALETAKDQFLSNANRFADIVTRKNK
ncbi:MAG: hypothetical protein AAGI23_05360 [Bacteroidota bacterium]